MDDDELVQEDEAHLAAGVKSQWLGILVFHYIRKHENGPYGSKLDKHDQPHRVAFVLVRLQIQEDNPYSYHPLAYLDPGSRDILLLEQQIMDLQQEEDGGVDHAPPLRIFQLIALVFIMLLNGLIVEAGRFYILSQILPFNLISKTSEIWLES